MLKRAKEALFERVSSAFLPPYCFTSLFKKSPPFPLKPPQKMSDSSYITLTRHRSVLSSSSLSTSSLSHGHPFSPSGRSSNLDVVDDDWARDRLPDMELEKGGEEVQGKVVKESVYGEGERVKEEKWNEVGIGWE
ncbi:hypothetical protein TrVE_jg5927 [Triparma verrucosa]|uniref:Uncharacterized protein n=1 Tax=Triparma verrucosa TaxID=1606542 RepID=A0A9W7EP14_9STRA|nr:hypothetical protein TrVE_jg5927 [Triparma verrucosa]